MSSPPMYFPAGFEMSAAKLCARLTSDAYDMYTQWTEQGRPRKEDDFHWTKPTGTDLSFSSPIWSTEKLWHFLDESEPFGFVARADDGTGYLVFRGTNSVSDWIADAESDQVPYHLVSGHGDVHHGFMKLYESMRDDVMSACGEVGPIAELWVTGHSLGCGLSTLAVPDVMNALTFERVRHYNFASPRVGSPAFTDAYNANGVTTFRVVNTSDIVPEVPPAILLKEQYKHVATPVTFTAQHGSLGGNHNLDNSYRYALDHPEDPEGQEEAPSS